MSQLATAVRGSWQQFLEAFEALRPELYRYCRHLTRSPWDAEDLAQDVLAKAFVTLAKLGAAPPNPRAWLFRVASNAWIDQQRRPRGLPDPAIATAVDPRSAREAAGTLLSRLAPQERAAVVLKDVFDLPIEDIAEALSTTPGAVKAALHRGRGKLVDEPVAEVERVPTSAALDAFCAAFDARDLAGLTALLLDTATVEVVGVTTEYGKEGGILRGMMFGSERLAEAATRGGIEARFVQGALPTPPRVEVRVHRGEPIVLVWYAHADGEAVRAIDRVELEGDRIARLRNYFFTPDVLVEVCGELGVPCRINGYKFWLECN